MIYPNLYTMLVTILDCNFEIGSVLYIENNIYVPYQLFM